MSATHSARNGITGSTRDALSPGTQLANTAVTASTTMIAPYVTGSLGVRSNKNRAQHARSSERAGETDDDADGCSVLSL